MLHLGSVFAHVFDPGLAEHRRHQARAEPAFGVVGRIATAAATAEQPLLAHLLDTDRHRDVVHPRGDRYEGLAECGRAGCAGVGDVDHGDAGLADLLEDALTDHRVSLIEVAAGEHLDVLDADAGVLERKDRGLAAEFRHRLGRITAELDHSGSQYVDVLHLGFSCRPAGVGAALLGRRAPIPSNIYV